MFPVDCSTCEFPFACSFGCRCNTMFRRSNSSRRSSQGSPQELNWAKVEDSDCVAEPGWDTEPKTPWTCTTCKKYVKMKHLAKLWRRSQAQIFVPGWEGPTSNCSLFPGTILRGAQCSWVAQLKTNHDELFHNGNGLGRNCVAQRCGLAYSIRAQRGDIESLATHDCPLIWGE